MENVVDIGMGNAPFVLYHWHLCSCSLIFKQWPAQGEPDKMQNNNSNL